MSVASDFNPAEKKYEYEITIFERAATTQSPGKLLALLKYWLERLPL